MGHGHRTVIPVFLLDVDGVINAGPAIPTHVWPRDQWVQTKVIGVPILAAQPVLDFIRQVHEQGRAEIRWHTTWQDDAPKLGEALGLPELPVQDAPEFRERQKERVFDRGYWWKKPAAERILAEGRPLVWADDDITWSLGRRGQDEMRQAGPVLFVSPDEQCGLTPKHLRQIGGFLDLYPPEVAAETAGHGASS